MRKVSLPVDLVGIHMEVIIETLDVVEFSDKENKEQQFLNIGINKVCLWILLYYRCLGSTMVVLTY